MRNGCDGVLEYHILSFNNIRTLEDLYDSIRYIELCIQKRHFWRYHDVNFVKSLTS
jgi:hypothetical protein